MKKYTNDYLLSGDQSGNGNEHLLNFLKSMAGSLKEKDVVEIGYGNGSLVPLLLAEGINQYYGIDFNENAFKISNERVKDPRVNFKHLNVKEIDENKSFDIVVMDSIIEHIPVYEMEIIWGKLKKILRPGGFIILKTQIYENPNILDEDEKKPETMGIYCHKQTLGTLLRTCLQHQFILAKTEGEIFGLIRQNDVGKFDKEVKEIFLNQHQQILTKFHLERKETYLKSELRNLVPGAGRLLVGCVAENTPKYRNQALRLVQSIRWFGENTAGVNIFVCLVDDADPEYVNELERWGVFVRIVKRFSNLHPPSNKLRLFELEEVAYYDTVMLLDCDTLFVRDPYPFITGKEFQADIAAGPTINQNQFSRLFTHYKLKMPPQKYRTTMSGKPTIWYCNAGVLIFPKDLLQSFYPVWKHYTIDLSKKKHLLGDRYFFCEQAALSLAFASHPVPFKKLPSILNWHLPANARVPRSVSDPVIIHYHSWGVNQAEYIKSTPNPSANRRINEFNYRYKIYRQTGEWSL